jgi:hypothetical protein
MCIRKFKTALGVTTIRRRHRTHSDDPGKSAVRVASSKAREVCGDLGIEIKEHQARGAAGNCTLPFPDWLDKPAVNGGTCGIC